LIVQISYFLRFWILAWYKGLWRNKQ